MKRDANIELYRCLLTFGIVILHTIGFYGKGWHWLSSAFVWCVPGFVFITGYFGVRFSLGRIAKLYGVCLWCFPVSILVGYCVSASGQMGDWILDSWRAFMGNWFVHAYAGLLMIVPLADAALKSAVEEGRCCEIKDYYRFFPFLFFVFVWSFLSNYNCVMRFLPKAPSCSVLTLLGTYIIARIFRACKYEERISTTLAWIVFVVCIALAMLRIGKFNSPISIGITIASFVLVKRIRIPRRLSEAAIWMGPSMFSVFLIHANKWCLGSMRGYVDSIVSYGLPFPFAFIIVAGGIFVGGLLLDLPRRIIVGRLRK